MPYPDSTRTVYIGIENVPNTAATSFHFMHTMNEVAQTLNTGLVPVNENTGTRVQRSGQARGRRSSTLRLQAYIRLQETGVFLESALSEGVSTVYPDRRVQTVTLSGSPTGGTFTIKIDGAETTPLAYNAAASAIQTAVEALPNVDPGDITVSGSGPWTFTFVGTLPGGTGPHWVTGDTGGLTGGTNPTITASTATNIAGAYLRTYKGGVGRGRSLTVRFYNGLYWREMKQCYVNTMNIQGFGDQLAMVDMELLSKASLSVVAPTPIPEDDSYVPVDMPMQWVRFGGMTNADALRMAVNINNNMTFRTPMDGSTSIGRTRWGFFDVALDGMADYPAYTGSLYEAFETGTRVAAMDLLFMDDLHTIGAGTIVGGTAINPYLKVRVPEPALEDMTEGDDGGELVQMIRGAAEYDQAEACSLIIELANDKDATYYAPS